MPTKVRMAARTAVVAVLGAVFLALPVSMVVGSLRTPGLPPPEGIEWLPDPLRWANYRDVRSFVPSWGTALANSVRVSLLAVPVTVLVASWAGFAIATASPRRRRALVVASVFVLLVPVSALWAPRFVLYRWLGLTDTLLAVAAPAVMGTTPFYVLLFALAYGRIPRALYEAAVVEGLSPLKTWWRVALPLGRPALAAVAMLAFTFHWSNLVDPLLYLSSPERTTLPLALQQLQALEPTNHPILLAGAVLVSAPALAAFLLAQRAFLVHAIGDRP